MLPKWGYEWRMNDEKSNEDDDLRLADEERIKGNKEKPLQYC